MASSSSPRETVFSAQSNVPSQANAGAFDRAVMEVSDAARRLLTSLHTHSPARDREIEVEKVRERSRARFG
jgi:hypothetical protein